MFGRLKTDHEQQHDIKDIGIVQCIIFCEYCITTENATHES